MERPDQIKIGLLAAILVTQLLVLVKPSAEGADSTGRIDAYIVGVQPGVNIDTNVKSIERGVLGEPISVCFEHASGLSAFKTCDNGVEVTNLR